MSRKAMQAKKPVEKAPVTGMRLDKFFKVSRLIKRRSVANDACDTGHVSVNGKEGKPGTTIKAVSYTHLWARKTRCRWPPES